MLDTAMTAWIGYAALSLAMAALSPIFIRAGARRTAPVIGALLYTGIIAVFLLGVTLLGGGPAALTSLSGRDMLFAALSALALSASCLCLFRALATGLVIRVFPMTNLSVIVLTVIGFLTFTKPFSLFAGIYLLVILLGSLLMVSVDYKYRDPAFLTFAAASGVLAAVSEYLRTQVDAAVSADSAALIAYAGAFLITLVFAFIGRSFSTLKKMTLESAIFTVSAGVAMGLSLLCKYYSGLYGLWSDLSYISAVPLPLTILFARLFGREKLTAANIFGLLIALAGLVALNLQLS